jgi:DivIVA domain-containing protein
VADDEGPGTGERENELSRAAPESGISEPQRYVTAEIRNVSFPASVRGYSRRAVDAYVNRVNRLIAELEVSASPRAAVRHALDRAGQQVSGLLEQARETAEKIIASGRQEAEEMVARGKAEAAELVGNARAEADRVRADAEKLRADARSEADEIRTQAGAEAEETLARSREEAEKRRQRLEEELAALRDEAETRLHEVDDETEAVSKRGQELIEEIHALARGLDELASAAAARFPHAKPRELTGEVPEPESEATAASVNLPTNAPARPMQAAASQRRGDDEADVDEPT